MKLTTQTDYALRTLMFLATRTSRSNVADVATLFGISVNHVAKVVNLLARGGYVRSIRGVGGGIELALPPEQISVGEVIANMEGDTHLLACVGTDDSCAIHSFCKLKGVLAEAERIQMEYLLGVTLAEVVPQKRQLNRIQIAANGSPDKPSSRS
ncbi:HTH-type transcriptional repressor NsrR [Roseimaritima multifibrata]|uniref:HTH-type transcriptional repressor NsrR n=1 Tax=Roseimaritima multifibrata TaxID=1930274 RepID=A0A517MB67_9BACT|nr:Rrf2 family transcriptional regulator [Roseimaritima multifibrata]QDS92128.1 HTH-type transcriptional repressor NsrR [Roseimaritima multifibrata]